MTLTPMWNKKIHHQALLPFDEYNISEKYSIVNPINLRGKNSRVKGDIKPTNCSP